jgi:hypothetical protein
MQLHCGCHKTLKPVRRAGFLSHPLERFDGFEAHTIRLGTAERIGSVMDSRDPDHPRYPGDASSNRTHLEYAGLASIALLAAGALVAFLGSRRHTAEHGADTRSGIIIGVSTGCVWVIEIGFNNFLDPKVSTASARFIVDNSAWGLIALIALIASCAQALHTRRFMSAIHVGLWSGLISGLISCLMGLLLVVVWMPFLLRDPINIQEYADRGAAGHSPGMAAYFACETMSGALGHLIILGLVMGVLLGAIGGLFALLLGFVRRGF